MEKPPRGQKVGLQAGDPGWLEGLLPVKVTWCEQGPWQKADSERLRGGRWESSVIAQGWMVYDNSLPWTSHITGKSVY